MEQINNSVFPKQNIPDKEKDSEWKRRCVNAVIYTLGASITSPNTWRQNNVQGKAELANYFTGDLRSEDYQYVTHPLMKLQSGSNFTYPAQLRNYNIIRPVFEELKGEYSKRRFDFNVVSVNPDSADQKNAIKIEYEVEKKFQETVQQWKAAGLNVDHLMQDMSVYKQYFDKGQKLPIEELCADSLEFLVYDTKFREKAIQAFEYLGIFDESVFKVYSVGEDVRLRAVNPLFLWFNAPHSSKYLDDCDMACELRWLTVAQILDEFQDELSDKQLNYIEECRQYIQTGYNASAIFSSDGSQPLYNYFYQERGNYMLPVWSVEWISRKQVGRPVGEDDASITAGHNFRNLELDKLNKPQKEKVHYINEVWEGVMIGGDIYPYIRPKKIQCRSFSNPSSVSLSYTGVCRTSINTIQKSFVAQGIMYQELYNILMYRFEQAVAASKGKAVIVDVSQLPKNEKFSMSLEMHEYYMQVPGVMYIDSAQIAETGIRPSNTVYQSVDRTNDNEIRSMIEAATFILGKWHELCGMTPQRLGSVQNDETVGGVERSVTQSSYITEWLFEAQSQSEQRVLTKLVETAKATWKAGRKLQFPVGEYNHRLIEIIKDFRYEDFAIYVSNNVEQRDNIAKVQELAGQAVQNGQANIMDYINIITSTSLGQMKRKLEEAFAKSQESAQQAAQAQQQMEQAAQKLEYDKLASDDKLNLRDNETKLKIAGMSAEQSQKDIALKAESDMQLAEQEKVKESEDSVSKDLSKKIEDSKKSEKGGEGGEKEAKPKKEAAK